MERDFIMMDKSLQVLVTAKRILFVYINDSLEPVFQQVTPLGSDTQLWQR